MPLILHSSPVRRSKPGPAADIPEWVATAISNGWAVGTWLRISGSEAQLTPGRGLENGYTGNTLQSVKTTTDGVASGLAGILESYSGGTIAPNLGGYGSCVLGLNGGHGTYNNANDVFRFDFGSRLWTEIVPSTYGTNLPTAQSAPYGECADGSPVNSHTAFWPFYDTARSEFVLPKGWQSSGLGSDQLSNYAEYGHYISAPAAEAGYAASQWQRLPLASMVNTSDKISAWLQQCGGAWDETRQKYWFWTQTNTWGIFGCYNSADRSLTDYSASWAGALKGAFMSGVGINAGYAIDPDRNALIIPQFRYGDSVMIYNLDAPSTYRSSNYTAWLATNTGTIPPDKGTAVGWAWAPNLSNPYSASGKGGFVAWNTAMLSNVAKALPTVQTPTFNSGQETNYGLEWSNMTTDATVAPVPYTILGGYMFGKFMVMSYGDIDIGYAITSVDGAVSAFRIT